MLVQENNSASRNSSTKTQKRATSVRRSRVSSQAIFRTKFSLIILVMITFQLPKLGVTSQNKFEGSGAVNNSGSINSRFAVRVVDVLPNNNHHRGCAPDFVFRESQTIIYCVVRCVLKTCNFS